MLSIITGRAKSGKTEKLLKLLKDNVASYNESLLFVPEQFSFNAEKMVLNSFGDKLNKITVVSFTSFCNELKRLYGGSAGKTISDSTRIMFLRKAIKHLEGELLLFKSSASAINSIDTVASAITEFKQASVSSDDLHNISTLYEDTLLGMKLHDISLIMSTYDALIGNKYIDPYDDLYRAYKQAKDNGFFCDKAVYFDAFSGFTGQQYNIIKQALIDSPNVAFTFCTDNKKQNDFGIFANVNNTVERIVKIAESVNVKEINRNHIEETRFKHDALTSVEKYFSSKDSESSDCSGIISFKKANNKYSELEFIATEIHKLVRTKGYRYRDIAVLTGNTDGYTSITESVFNKLNVPIFTDKKVTLIETPLASFILSVLRAAKNYSSSEILKYIKCGLTDFTPQEISDIDDYVYLWNIKPEDWSVSWQKNPYGLREVSEEKLESRLKYLNTLREKIISPLKYFNSIKKAPTKEICKKLFKLLEQNSVASNLIAYVEKMKDEGNHNQAQYIISSWENLNAILDDNSDCYGEDPVSLKEYIEILEFSFKKHSLGGIPQGLDEVYFANAARIERGDFKVVFVFGLNYGEFPNFNIDSGLFNPYERGRLIGNSVNISDTYISAAVEENYCLYKALTSADEKLYLSYRFGDYNGKTCEPSSDYLGLVKLFSAHVSDAENDDIESPLQAFNLLFEDKFSQSAKNEVKEFFNYDDFWREKLRIISSIDSNQTDYINSEIAKRLYGENTTTTASKIEQYFKCPYAYFLKFGLNITKPVPIDFKRMQRGQIVHYVLEKFIQEKLQDFENISSQELNVIINGYIQSYIKNNVGSADILDEYSKYILKRILELLVELIPWICAELTNSEFKPMEYEYNLNNDEIEPISLTGGTGSIRINGVIDRFDMFKQDDKDYIRIVDYKTGVKKIKLSDILYGLNLQMFIYMSAICESEKYKSIPAGVLYQPVNHIVRKGVNGDVSDFPKVIGVLTSDTEILQHMDPKGEYMPFKLTSSGNPDKRSLCISNDDFKEIFKYIKNKIIHMNDCLLEGKISKDPCDSDSSHRTCGYCDYRDVCGRADDEINRVVENISTDEVLKIIEEENKR